jgi:hypothetical protein
LERFALFPWQSNGAGHARFNARPDQSGARVPRGRESPAHRGRRTRSTPTRSTPTRSTARRQTQPRRTPLTKRAALDAVRVG